MHESPDKIVLIALAFLLIITILIISRTISTEALYDREFDYGIEA